MLFKVCSAYFFVHLRTICSSIATQTQSGMGSPILIINQEDALVEEAAFSLIYTMGILIKYGVATAVWASIHKLLYYLRTLHVCFLVSTMLFLSLWLWYNLTSGIVIPPTVLSHFSKFILFTLHPNGSPSLLSSQSSPYKFLSTLLPPLLLREGESPLGYHPILEHLVSARLCTFSPTGIVQTVLEGHRDPMASNRVRDSPYSHC